MGVGSLYAPACLWFLHSGPGLGGGGPGGVVVKLAPT